MPCRVGGLLKSKRSCWSQINLLDLGFFDSYVFFCIFCWIFDVLIFVDFLDHTLGVQVPP